MSLVLVARTAADGEREGEEGRTPHAGREDRSWAATSEAPMATTVNAAFMVLVGGGRVWWVVVMGTEMAMAMRMETRTEGRGRARMLLCMLGREVVLMR